jgi:glycosyltransferase involved in cell wall biosynthesis
LLAGRLQAHKNNELVIKIFNELGLPLHVAGTGRQENYLKSMAKSNITFLGRVSDEDLRAQYSGALGLIYPQLEDFGLMPLEVACCGTATLAYGKGGVLETVVPGVTGELFGTDDVARPFMGWSENMAADKSARYKYQIKQLILSWNPQKYKFDDLRAQAEKFSKEKFKQAVLKFLETNNFHGRESH